MVGMNIDERLKEIKELVGEGKYFTINKARQYGKTTTLMDVIEEFEKESSSERFTLPVGRSPVSKILTGLNRIPKLHAAAAVTTPQ